MANNTYSPFIQLFFLCCIATSTLSCGSFNKEETSQPYLSINKEVIPEDIWIPDAENRLNIDIAKLTNYILYASLFDTKREVEMHFDSNRRLFLIRILNDLGYRHDLFFEEGRLAFSEHYDIDNNTEWIMAYANGKVYAAALKANEKWKGILPEEVHLRPQLIDSALSVGITYQNKEETSSLPGRILENRSEIASVFKHQSSIPFVLNVRKGDHISIHLEDASKNSYFTIDFGNKSQIEHQQWNGITDITGDITINVFSANPEVDRKFTLKTEIIPQTRGYALAQ